MAESIEDVVVVRGFSKSADLSISCSGGTLDYTIQRSEMSEKELSEALLRVAASLAAGAYGGSEGA